MEQVNLNDVLVWLYSAGGATVVASFILERVQAFQDLNRSEQREAIYVLLSVVLSLGALFTLNHVPADVLNQVAPYFNAAVGTVLVVLFGKVSHRFDSH